MKKFLKAFFGALLSVIILTSTLILNTSAAGTIISFSKNTLTVGETLSVSVTIDAGAAMYGVMCSVNYDSSVLEYKSGGGAGGAGSVRIVESPSGETKVSYTLTFSTIKSGSSAVAVSDVIVSVQGANGSEEKSLTGASANVTVKDVTLSSNANLSALSLSAGTLSPKFNPSTTTYTATVNNSVTSCNIYATAADSAAKVAVSGVSALKIGKNIRTVTVTAPSGAQKTYTVTISRSAEEKPVASSTPSEDNKNFTATIEGVEYTVAKDISNVKLFKGFTASTAKYNEEDVAVAVDANNNYKLYYLKAPDSNELIPYCYDETNKLFTKLAYFTQGENTYIYSDFPVDFNATDEFYTTTAKIDNNDVKCFANNNSLYSDFYYLYCYSNGAYGFYRYDTIDNVLQRYPEMETLAIKPVENEETEENEEKTKDNLVTRFASLSGNAKTLIISFVLLVLSGIALIVLLIIKHIKNKEFDEFLDDDEIIEEKAFDDIILDNFSISNKEPTTDTTTDEDIVEETEEIATESEIMAEDTQSTEN